MATDHNFRIKNGLEVGGQLIVNSSGQLVVADIVANQKFHDNVKLRFGNSSDLQIYHDGSNSYIDEAGTGELRLRSNEVELRDMGNEVLARFSSGGSSVLFYDNAEKFETTSGGVNVVGNILDIGGANPHIRGTHASAMRIKHTSTQTMYIRPDESGVVSFFEGSTGGTVYLMTQSPTVNNTTNNSTPLYFQTRSKKADGTSQSQTAQIRHITTGISTNHTELLFSGATHYRMDNGLFVGSTAGAHVFLGNSGGIEIARTSGGADPYIDFKDSASDDYDVRLQMDDNKFIIKTGGAGNIVTAATFDNNGRLYLDGQTGSYLDYNSTYLRHTTPYGYIEMGPGNTAHAHIMTNRPNFYFNKEIQVDTGIIGSHNEDLILRRAQTSADGQLILKRGKFVGTSQSASDLLNSSMIIGGFTANTGAEEAGNHFYIPGLSPNNLAGADRRLTVTITKNGSAYTPSSVGNMFTSTTSFGGFSHAAGTTDTIVITITGVQLSYAQYYGVQFGHPSFRAKSIEIERSTDSGANWTSIYDVANFPDSTVNHYHGGSGTSTNAIRYTFTDFASTGMRINQLFAYDYSESITHNLESYVDSTIRANYRWNDGYKAKFGSSDDLQIYHSGTHSFIQDTGVGSLYLDTSGLIVRNPSNNANVLIATPTDVQLFAGGGTAKLQTASWGVLVNGILNADGLHIGTGASDLISVRNDSTTTQIATYRNELGGFITRTYGDHGNDGTLVEYQERVGADGNYVSIGTHGAHALQIRTGNTNRLDISSGGNVEVQGTGLFTAPTIRLTNNGTDTAAHRVSVYDSGTTSYGMMLWNDNGSSGDWATMIYGPDQANRKISFGKINNNTNFFNHSHVDEIAYFDLDNQNLYLTDGTLFATGASDGVVARKGAFGPSQPGLHGTYDLYNNGTTYLNGVVTVDDNLDIVNKIRHVGDTDTYLSFPNNDDFRIVVGNSTRAAFNISKIHFNQEGINQDFQVESNTSSHMLFVDASADRVGMGTGAPEFPVHIQGSVDGDFNVGIFNTKSYGTGTGTNETTTLSLGIKEANTAAAARIFGQIRVATLTESDSSTGKMTFHVRDGGTVTERATLSAAGNLNIDGGLYTSHINTGQGNTEVHLMNQNLRTTDSPTFATLNVTGDLNITGDINTVSVTDLDIQDKTITVSAGAASSSAADESGLIIGGAGSKILWDHAEDKFQFSHGINFDRDTYSETNQNLGVYWSAWDKESSGDKSDKAYIRHTENVGGHSNSVLELKSGNDSGDGIAFTTHSGSTLKHNSSNILTVANFTTNITNLLTATTTFGGDVDGTYNSLVIDVPTQTSAPTASTGRLWWDSNSGNLKIYNGSVWVTASAIPDVSTKYDKTGGAISGSVSITSTLAVSGIITGSSTIQGSTIVKTGGTSSQFLKADGSVDSSTYLTGNQTITLTGDASGSGTTTIPVVVANDSHNHSSSSGNFSVGGTLFVPQKIEHTGDSNTYMEFDSGDQWRVVTGGVERIRVIGGDVGIGDVDPTDGDLTLNSPKLHVKGPGTTNKFNLVARFQGGTDSDNTGGAILINHSNDRGLLIEGGRSSSDRGVGYIGLLNSSAAHTRIMGFYQDGTTYTAGINIDPGTYPHTDLQVGNPETASTGITIASRYDQGAAKLTFRSGHPQNNNVWNTSQITSTDDGNYNGRLEFRTSTSGQAAPSTKMFIRANGRVGVGSGVFTPDTTLHVNGTFKVNQGSDYLGMQTTTVNSGNLWANWINGSESNFRMSLYNNGTGNGSSQYAFKFGLHYGTTSNANIKFWRGGSGTGGFLTFTTDTDTERMRITTAGDIGINMSTPESVLHILDPGAADGQITLSGMYNSAEHNAGRLYFKHDASWTTELRLGTASNHSASYRDELTIKAGKVGISNTTPDAQLHVKSTGASYGSGSIAAIFEDTTARATVRIRSTTDDPAELFFDSNGAMRWDFSTRGSSQGYRLDLYGQHSTPSYTAVAGPYVTVLQSGYVGFNDANPGNRLEVNEPTNYKGIHVRGSNAPQITFGRGTNSAAEWKAGIAGSNGASFSISSGTGNQDRLHIESNGETGIGTSSPDALLEVNGSFKAKTVMLSGAHNFDNLAKSGFYNIYNGTASGHTNAPFQYGSMLVVGNNKASNGFTMQLAHERTGNGTFIRGMNDSGSTWYSWQRIFQDNYHPNADKWTTARSHTVTLNGAVTGTATQSVDGTGNKTWTISTAYNGAYSETDTLASVTGRGATTSTQSSFNSGIITQANGIRLSRTQTNSSIWFNGSSATDANHVLWNAAYGTTPTSRPGTSGAFDGMMWNTLRGIKIRGGSAGAYNLIVAENSSGATNNHTVKLYASNVKRFETTTGGAAIESTLLLGSYTDASKQGKLVLGGNVANKQAEIKCTNGNLHIDSENTSATYLNYYEGTAGVAFGTGASGVAAWMGPDGDLWKGSSDNTGSRYFNDGYHPNADKWTTARSHTVTLTGEVTGTATQSVDGTGNKTWSIATSMNNSSLDDQYVTVGSRYSGDGDSLVVNNKASIRSWDVSTASDAPSSASDGLVLSAGWDSSSWGVQQYHDFHSNDLYLRAKNNGSMTSWDRVFHDTYHPNADKWTTSRTLTLSGDVSGSVSFDGSGAINMTNTVVANDSHTHDTRYLIKTGDTATGIHEVDGRWHFNPSTNSSYREGIRLNRSTTGWGAAVFGGVRDSIDGITEAWWVARNPSKNLVLSYGTSADSGGLLLTHNNTTMKYKNQRVFMDDYHPNADTWTTARTDTVTLTGDATGTASASVNGSGNWTNSIAVTVNNIDGQAFINTRSNSAQSVQGVDGNGIYYYSSGTDNFSGNSTDGAAYQQSYSSSWRHTINGDYRSGAIAVKSRNSGVWQETKRIPMIFTGSTTPTITTHADNCELWFDTSVGKLKFYHNDGTTTAWVDAVAVPSISTLYSKGGGTISGSVSISNTLNVVGITELDNELFVDKLAGANGTSNQIARFSNITSGATSGYIYLGASSGTDWKVGKNVAGTSGSSQFDIATHTNALALSVNVSRGIIAHTGEIHSNNAFAFLTVGSGAQNVRTKSVFAGTSYGDTPPAGSFNATNTYEQNGTTVIDASKNLQSIASINLSGQINFNGTTYKINPYEQSNYRGGANTSHSARRGLNFYHSSGPQMTLWYHPSGTGVGNLKIFSNNTGVGDVFQFENDGDFHAKGDITAYSTTTTSDARLKENVRDLEGSLDKTLKLRGVKFDWIDESKSKDNLGFIAQEVEEVIPEVVKDITNIDGEEHKVVNYQAVVPVLVEAIKEQQSLINRLEARLNELEKSMEKK